jgi:CheY-like chemotaxis protein
MAASLERLTQEAHAAQAREVALRQAERMKDEFLAVLGHELRNPLSAMAAAAYLLRKTASGERPAQAAQIVSRQVEQMTRLIEDLLDVTRVTRGKVSLSKGPLELSRLVAKTVEELRGAGRLDRHAVRTELGEAWVRADDARLQQIVANLVGNAVKYTPEGGEIVVSLRRERDEAILRVRDSGMGMSPELAARVFDLFVQGESQQRRGGGLGIGLTLVKHLAELHGGKVFAASPGAGQGSAFTVTLPAIEAQADYGAHNVLTVPPHARHRIVLVEDHAETRNTMFDALSEDGHRVYEAADGVDAIRTIEALKPDVAVVDLGLPRLDGLRVASALKETPGRDRMVLIAMTGLERPDTQRRAREAGFDDYLTKPVAPDHLVKAIEAAKARRAAATSM